MSQTRRLAAILAADVAGYSRLIGADEGGALERLRALRRELLDPKIAEHRGRLVKTTGDGLPVEFSSVVDALRCAVEVQRGMIERNAAVPPDDRIEFRIGINMGDVIVKGEDLYGDGVYIAARIEALADAGGVSVSNTVHATCATNYLSILRLHDTRHSARAPSRRNYWQSPSPACARPGCRRSE